MEMDWASIAQQWIKMKKDGVQIPPAPMIGEDFNNQQETEMDIEKDDEDNSSQDQSDWSSLQQFQQSEQHHKNQQISPWTIIPTGFSNTNTQQQHHWRSASNPWVTPNTQKSIPSLVAAPGLESINIYSIANDTPKPPPAPSNPDMWSSKAQFMHKNSVTLIPSDHSSNIVQEDMTLDNSDSEDTTQTIDGNQRKLLPAWIREGLEKMEREKQKETERQREMKEREKLLEQRKKEEVEAYLELQKDRNRRNLESDNESVDEEEKTEKKSEIETVVVKNREYPPIPDKSFLHYSLKQQLGTTKILTTKKSREERFQEMMKTVRESLTNILLEVTNEMIYDIINETISKYRKKVQLRKNAKNALTLLTGLDAYSGSSDSENESEQENDEKDEDSEVEIKERLKKRQAAFEIKSKEIEERLDEEQEREEKLREQQAAEDEKEDFNSDSSNEGFMDKKNQRSDDAKRVKEGSMMEKYDTIYSIAGRMREKKPSRFSEPGDTVRGTHVTHVAIVDKINRYHIPPGSSNGSRPVIGSVDSKLTTVPSISSKRSNSSNGSSSESEYRRRKHKKHKKSSKSKSSKSKRHDRNDSEDDYEERHRKRDKRDREYEHRTRHRSERSSIESKSSVRSDRSEKHRKPTRSRSRSRDRRHRY